jgi:hypothetical protein
MTTNRIRYNYVFLQEFCKEHNIILMKDYSNEKLNRAYKIEGKCCYEECNDLFFKSLNALYIYKNYFCKYHSDCLRNEKWKKTCLEKYGVENVSQSDIIKKKKIETCLQNYGVPFSLQSKNVREKSKNTCLEKYGVENPLQSTQFKEKSKNTCLEKYGVAFVFQSKDVREKSKNTCLEKYGVENPLQSKEVIKKLQQTNLDKYGNKCSLHSFENQEKTKKTLQKNYGIDNPSQSDIIKKKKIETCLQNYGVEHPSQSKEISEKSKKTCMNKYGVEHPLQSKEVIEKMVINNNIKFGVDFPLQNSVIMEKCYKNAYKLKDYTLPSGNIIKIQGYENYALDELLKDGILEEYIINGCKNVPEIWYIDENNKKHRHYVDIFIPSQNRCIEVKSTWTAEKKKDCIFLKQQAGKELGYIYELWVYNRKGEKVECYK